MKLEYPLSFTSIHTGNFESQLKQFCIDNKFLYSGIQWNSFADGTYVLWTNVEWLKNRKYPTGEFLRYPDGSIKKDRKILINKLRIFPHTFSLPEAKEYLSLEILQELFINDIGKQEVTVLKVNENENERCDP